MIKNIEKIVQKERNERSLELFGKYESELYIGELGILDQYIKDSRNPIWKMIQINGKDTDYEVNNIGIIRRIGSTKNMSPYVNKNNGYASIGITLNGNSITLLVHRLVAITFIPNPENKPQVNHISGVKTCNWVGNLEWNTRKENMQHAVNIGLLDIKGEKHPENIYSEFQIRKVCKLLESCNIKPKEIERLTGVSRDMIFRIREKSTWTHISKDYNIQDIDFSGIYIDDEIIYACELLQNPDLSYDYIYMASGVKPQTLADIVRKHSYKRISSKYNIPNRNITVSNCTNEQIHHVCRLLTNPKLSAKEISKQTGVSIDTVHSVSTGKTWKQISSMYNLPEKRSPNRNCKPSPKIQQVIDWINEGKSKEDIIKNIMLKFDVPDQTKASKCYIDTKRKYVSVKSSSTIDQL